MNIYLIADDASAVLMQPLVAYIQPFFCDRAEFHIRHYSGEVKSCWKWEELFAVGHKEKTKSLLPPGEHYFLFMFNGANVHNWFGAMNLDEPNVGFLQSFGWEKYDFKEPIYPIAYHLMTLVTAMKFFGRDQNLDFYHGVSKGCMFDFTGVKEEVRYKLQSANICPDCLTKIAQQAGDRVEAMDYMQRLLTLFRSVKEHLFAIDLQQHFGELDYRLSLKEDASLELMVDGNYIPLQISSGREKALYIMLLKHENGLSYKDFEKEHLLKEYLGIYFRFFVNKGSSDSLLRQAKHQIADRKFRKQLEPLVSKIRKKLVLSLSAYPYILNAVCIELRLGSLLIPLQRQRFVNDLNKSKLG
jgi:hypothetical protein